MLELAVGSEGHDHSWEWQVDVLFGSVPGMAADLGIGRPFILQTNMWPMLLLPFHQTGRFFSLPLGTEGAGEMGPDLDPTSDKDL